MRVGSDWVQLVGLDRYVCAGIKVNVPCQCHGVFVCTITCAFLFTRESVFEELNVKRIKLLKHLEKYSVLLSVSFQNCEGMPSFYVAAVTVCVHTPASIRTYTCTQTHTYTTQMLT